MRNLPRFLHCLSRFLTTRMVQQFGRHEFIPTHSDEHKRANLRRATGDAKKQLRCAVSPMEAQCEVFFDVVHRGFMFQKRFNFKKEARITGLQDDIGAWVNVYLCAT
jgi:hypothetical protein